MRSVRFPIRLKILLGLLAVVSIVVTLITYTMATLFHTDKTAYIHDLASVMALRAADETRSLLLSYQERLQTYAIVLGEKTVDEERRLEIVRRLLEGFPECVAISVYDAPGHQLSTLYDAEVIEQAGLSKTAVSSAMNEMDAPWDQIAAGEPYLRSATFADRLPSFILATRTQSDETEGAVGFVVAVMTPGDLMRPAVREGAFDTFVTDRERILLAHQDPARVRDRGTPDWLPDTSSDALTLALGVTREYRVRETEMIGGFAATGFDGAMAGVQIPKSAAYLASRRLLGNLVAVALGLLLLAALAALFWARRITASIERLAGATTQVARGDFDVQVDERGHDEIAGLAGSFNRMTTELQSRESALQATHAQLVQSEKIAAFGQLGAGIAHEIKNPLAGILGCAQLSLRGAEAGSPLETNLRMIEKETRRCKGIIESLLKFARQEKTELRQTDLGAAVTDAAAIVRHQLELAGVHLEAQVEPDLPDILGNGNQIQQVVVNLLINAQQAMAGRAGRVTVYAGYRDADHLCVSVTDDGPGIPKEDQPRIFEPFFTTKPSGVGTGLGLSVSYGIIRDHGGKIELESEVGQGTTFRLIFPVRRAEAGDGAGSGLAAAA